MKTLNFLIISATICSLKASSQDTLYINSGEPIIGKVIEVGTEQIKYKKQSGADGPSYVLNKSDVSSIHYLDGTKDVFSYSSNTPHYNVASSDNPSVKSPNQNNSAENQNSNSPAVNTQVVNNNYVNQGNYGNPRPVLNAFLGAFTILAATHNGHGGYRYNSGYSRPYNNFNRCEPRRGRHW